MSGEQAPSVLSTRKRNRHDRPLLCGVDATAGGRAVVSIAGALAARLLLVGSRGRGRFTRALLGSVSTAVAARATSPVCVVPSDEDWSAHP
nr:universal stress protein [Actinomycetota bacterium]